jgi:hypothetical protein
MYTAGLSIVAKTQELSIMGQLMNGIRYFDLRPKYDAATIASISITAASKVRHWRPCSTTSETSPADIKS